MWINEIYIESEYRRKGKASEILEFIEKWAKDKEIKYIATMTSKKILDQKVYSKIWNINWKK